MQPPAPRVSHHVTAVLVAHDGGRWLPTVLAAVAAQSRGPDRLVAVDTASTDGSAVLLAAAPVVDAVVTVPRRTGFGAAVRAGLAAEGQQPAADETRDWVWLLHDDCAPDPGALQALLEQADATPSAGVLGPKVRGWHEPDALVEVGLTVDRAGRRETRLEADELDQGQHDGVAEVLAVGTAGALVRRDLWDRLGGLDPALPLFGDDLDLGWRANLAGARVLVVTDAVVHHLAAAASGARPVAAVPKASARVRRRAAVYTMLANLPLLSALVLLVRLVIGAVAGGVVRLVLRRPGAAADELLAVFGVLAHPLRLLRARWARRRTRVLPARAALRLLADRRLRWRRYGDAVADRASRVLQPVSGRQQSGLLRALLLRPPVLLGAVLSLLALVGSRSLLGTGVLAGGRLLPAPSGAGDLWSGYLASWHPIGAGTPAPAPPYLALLAGVAAVFLGRAPLAVDVLLLGAVPLAGLSAYAATRRLTSRRPLRVWAAATYALLPAVTGAVAGGRLDAVAAIVLLPLVLSAVGRALLADRRDGWRPAWLGALGLAVAAAFAPVVYLLAAPLLAGALLLAVASLARRRTRWRGVRRAVAAVVLLTVPPLLLLPWLPALRDHPRAAVAGFGPAAAGLVDPALRPVDLLLLHPGGPGLPSWWLGAPLLVAALAGLARSRRWRVALAGWAVAAIGVGGAAVVARLTAAPLAGGEATPVWPGVPTAFAAAGLLVAAVVAADGLFGRLTGASFSWRQPVAVLLTAAAAGVPLLAAVSWVDGRTDTGLQRRPASALPAFVAAEMTGPAQTRTLLLRPQADGTLRFAVLRGGRSVLGQADLASAPGSTVRLAALVRDLSAGRGGQVAARLRTGAVGFVYLPPTADGRLARVLDGITGLSRVAAAPGVRLWQVAGPAARLTLAAPNGQLTTVPSGPAATTAALPPGPGGRTLVLAEPADPGWRATLDGRPLPRRTVYGWAQGFPVPAAGGRLQLRHENPVLRRDLLAQGALLGVVLLLSLPAARRPDHRPPRPEPAPSVIDLRDPADVPAVGARR